MNAVPDPSAAAAPPAAVLIAGPTASGKSALALELAVRANGVILNADSMQVYRDLRLITARPTPEEEAQAPHRLYGHRDAAENCSVGTWLADAAAALAQVRADGKLPIVVGGTGLYFKALTRGLAAVPPVPGAVRDKVRARLAAEGIDALRAELARHDPVSAARLSPNDTTRITRALEVVLATGRSLPDWQAGATGKGVPPLIASGRAVAVFLAPERDWLYARIDARFDAMLAQGALEEVRKLAARGLDPLLPAMKAHGVPGLIRYLAGTLPLDAAAAQGRQDTRHYAKRQFTWFRHQLPEFQWLTPDAAREYLLRARGPSPVGVGTG